MAAALVSDRMSPMSPAPLKTVSSGMTTGAGGAADAVLVAVVRSATGTTLVGAEGEPPQLTVSTHQARTGKNRTGVLGSIGAQGRG